MSTDTSSSEEVTVDARPEALMLTTIDNPFDPFDQFNEWLMWDTKAGYYTPIYLARIVVTSDELSDADQQLAINDAIEEIVSHNVLGIYRKVTRTR